LLDTARRANDHGRWLEIGQENKETGL
jgi:hypothetical protein